MTILSFQARNGFTVLVETDDKPAGHALVAQPGTRAVEEAKARFEDALDTLRPVADALMDQVAGLVSAPDEVEATVGIKFSGELGVIIARSSLEATLLVKLRWKTNAQQDHGA